MKRLALATCATIILSCSGGDPTGGGGTGAAAGSGGSAGSAGSGGSAGAGGTAGTGGAGGTAGSAGMGGSGGAGGAGGCLTEGETRCNGTSLETCFGGTWVTRTCGVSCAQGAASASCVDIDGLNADFAGAYADPYVDDSWQYVWSYDSVTDRQVDFENYPGFGGVTPGTTPTIQITGAETQYDTCSTCILGYSGTREFLADAGSVTVTALGSNIGDIFAITYTDVSMREVTIDWTGTLASTDVPNGQRWNLASHIVATISGPFPCDWYTTLLGESWCNVDVAIECRDIDATYDYEHLRLREDCAAGGLTCLDNAAVTSATCVDACTPAENGTTRCNGDLLESCDGTSWSLQADCAARDQVCDATSTPVCISDPCAVLDDMRCRGSMLQRCNGITWQDDADCGAFYACDETLPGCVAATCTAPENGWGRCAGEMPQTCDGTRWNDGTVCPAMGRVCVEAGTAANCFEPCDMATDTKRCVGDLLDTCTAGIWARTEDCAVVTRTCNDDGDNSACICPVGFVEEPGSGNCVPDVPPSCANSHTTGDTYEPDECPTEAKAIAIGETQSRTIEPNTPTPDQDWISFTATAGQIFTLEIIDGTVTDTYIYLYDTDGTSILRQHDTPDSLKYDFDTAGTYYARVRGDSSSYTGTYTATLIDEGFDDHGDDATAATAVTIDAATPTDGDIETWGDQDWFSFDALAGHVYNIAVTDVGLTDNYLALYDTDGTSILWSGDSPETFPWDFAVGGTYYLRVRGDASTYVGTYNLTVSDLGVDDHGDDGANATAVTIDATPTAGNIETWSDTDWFAFDAIAGHIYQLEVIETGLTDSYISLYDTDGTSLLVAYDSPESFPYEFDTGGTYFLRVRGDPSSYLGTYTFSVTDLGVDDHGDDATASTPVTVDATPTTGNLETVGDSDWFSFVAVADHIYRLEVTEVGLFDSYVYLYDTDGSTIIQSGDTPESYPYEFTTGGTYYFRVRADPTTYLGTYTFSVTDLGFDDHGDDSAGATAVTVDATATPGELETVGDDDWFSFVAVADHIYNLEVIETALSDSYVYLYDTDGVSILTSGDTPEIFTYEFAAGGTYFFRVRADPTSVLGTYTFAVTDLGLDDHGDDNTVASTLPTDGTVINGNIETRGDADWYVFASGASVAFVLNTTGVTTRKTVYEADGTSQVATTTASTNFAFSVPATSATYYLKVEASSAGTTGVYTIALQN